jgi:hypothetical protein
MTLFDKIFQILSELFKKIGVTVKKPVTNDIGDSESDYDD